MSPPAVPLPLRSARVASSRAHSSGPGNRPGRPVLDSPVRSASAAPSSAAEAPPPQRQAQRVALTLEQTEAKWQALRARIKAKEERAGRLARGSEVGFDGPQSAQVGPSISVEVSAYPAQDMHAVLELDRGEKKNPWGGSFGRGASREPSNWS